jgi:tyrosyl-tRNA synthetase
MGKKLIISLLCLASITLFAYRYSIVNANIPDKVNVYEYKSGESAKIEDVTYTVEYEVSDMPFNDYFENVPKHVIKKYLKIDIKLENHGESVLSLEETVLFTNDLRTGNNLYGSEYRSDNLGSIEPGEVKQITKYTFIDEEAMTYGLYYRAPSTFLSVKDLSKKEQLEKLVNYYEWKIEF